MCNKNSKQIQEVQVLSPLLLLPLKNAFNHSDIFKNYIYETKVTVNFTEPKKMGS